MNNINIINVEGEQEHRNEKPTNPTNLRRKSPIRPADPETRILSTTTLQTETASRELGFQTTSPGNQRVLCTGS